jgi:hypothetical protein
MTYKFDNIRVTDPKMEFYEGNTVGEFVTIWVTINDSFEWMFGAMPFGSDRDEWVAEQLKQYEIPN